MNAVDTLEVVTCDELYGQFCNYSGRLRDRQIDRCHSLK